MIEIIDNVILVTQHPTGNIYRFRKMGTLDSYYFDIFTRTHKKKGFGIIHDPHDTINGLNNGVTLRSLINFDKL
jgi:hypothetical protein